MCLLKDSGGVGMVLLAECLFFPPRYGSVEEVLRFCLAPGSPTLKEHINPTQKISLLTSEEMH